MNPGEDEGESGPQAAPPGLDRSRWPGRGPRRHAGGLPAPPPADPARGLAPVATSPSAPGSEASTRPTTRLPALQTERPAEPPASAATPSPSRGDCITP